MHARPAPRAAATAVPALRERRRAERASTSARTPVRHVTLPFCETGRAEPLPGETIGAFLDRTAWAKRAGLRWAFTLPTICVVNGAPVPQRHWKRRRIKPGDTVEFWSRPWGGPGGSSGTSGGSNTAAKAVIGIVALIALTAIAGPAGTAIAGALGLGAIAASIITGAIVVGGGLLIASLTRPSAGGQNAADSTTDQVEQLYSVSAQGNVTRLLQPLTVQYGRVKSFPDFATTPWSEFDGNDMYLNVLLGIGLGKYDHETLYIDDTILWTAAGGISATFTGVTLDFYDPGEQITLFPLNVTQSSEVSGQTLPGGTGGRPPLGSSGGGGLGTAGDWVGGFVANAAGSTATDIAVDLVLPNGCFALTPSGTLVNRTIEVECEVRPVNGAGAPTGPFVQLFFESRTFATRQPQRLTIKRTLATPGRYEVRVRRTGEELNGESGSDQIAWAGLRAFITGPQSFPVSTVAIRIKATSQLTTSSARKFGYLGTRILFVWNTALQIFTEQPTRNPFWAAYDAATDSVYGLNRPPSKVDFQAVFDQAAAADARGDTFDYRFSAAVAAPEALDTILKVARSRHRWSGDVLTFVRDEWSDVPRMLLTDREIVRGSLSIEYALNPDDASDAVILEYVDEDIWNPAEIQYPRNDVDFTAINPARIRVSGIVNREHAHRETAFYYLQSQLRRVNVGLDTEHDGRMLGFGSRVRVQTELPLSWGSTGFVVSRSTNTLTVSPAPTWGTGSHFIAIRTKTGRQFGPVLCTQGVDTAHIVLNSGDLAAVEAAQSMTLAAALARADGADDPSFDFGPGTNRARDCIVMTGRPNGDRVTLGLAVDVEAVHSTDLTETPILPGPNPLLDPRTPIVAGLFATFRQGVAEPILDASWLPATGAQYYVARVSYDGGVTFAQVYEGIAPNFSTVVERAGLRLQVAGVGVRHGPYSTVDLDAPSIQIGPGVVGLISFNEALANYVTNELQLANDARRGIEQLIASFAAEQEAANYLDKLAQQTALFDEKTARFVEIAARKDADAAIQENVNTVETRVGAAESSITTTQQSITTLDGAFATFQTDVTARFEDNEADISTNATAIADATGAFATFSTDVTARFKDNESAISTNATAITTVDGAFATFTTDVTARFDDAESNISTNATAIADANSAFSTFKTTISARVQENEASVTSASTAIVSLAGSFSNFSTEATANFNGLSASISEQGTAIATVDGKVAAIWQLSVNVNGKVGGMKLGNDGSTAFLDIEADFVRIGASGVPGGEFLPVWQVGVSGGEAKMVLRGDIIADGALTARMVTTGQFITLSAQIGDAVITNAHIKNLEVETIKIKGDAITPSNFTSDNAQFAIHPTVGTDLVIPAVAIAFKGVGGSTVKIQVVATFSLTLSVGENANVSILRDTDSQVIWTASADAAAGGKSFTVCDFVTASGNTDTWTYSLRIRGGSDVHNNSFVSQRRLAVFAFLR